ncbi:hypothetical protein CCHL11_02188 [Colletotrichum chlorophyti]|uniref:BZIP domain-containing protein n=1 Tax=Colletotrichum chlorophyti TaxID=708187 RepID=A0A1Q8S6T9_9PEZI|nr:hypothetical protein CCHL11_02188 [Colletotrichum chlorophyti]
MSSADVEARRRERGVIAQREYRKRHASKVQFLQDENRKLKDAIASITEALGGSGATLPDNVKVALSKARHIAGITESAGEIDKDQGEGRVETPKEPEGRVPSTSALLVAKATHGDGSASEVQLVASGHLSPRLDYGLWLEADRLIRVIDPPLDIIPYMGVGTSTLAGTIFWATMNYSIDIWNSRTSPTAVNFLDRMFNHSRHLTDRHFLLSLAQSRVDYKQKGYMFRKLSEQFERNAMTDMQNLIEADYERNGQPSKWWKKPEEVATIILDQLTSEERVRFDAVLEGKGTKADEELMRPLITWLAQNFICFGNGPRWGAVFIFVGVGGWLKEIRKVEPSFHVAESAS